MEEAEQAARSAHDRATELVEREPRQLGLRLTLLRSTGQLSEVLRGRGQAREALDVCRHEQLQLTRLRITFPDHREATRTEGLLLREQAECHSALGELNEAADLFRQSLQLQRQAFRSGVKPVQWSLAVFFQGQFRDAAYDQPGPFDEYCRTQLRFSRVLYQLGRFHEAELELGEAMTMSQIQNDGQPEQLRFLITRQRLCGSVRVAQRAPRYRGQSDAASGRGVWYRTTQQFPQRARSYRSGVRGSQCDLAWFEQTYPQQPVDERAAKLVTGKLRSGTVFWEHTTGVQLLEGGLWQDAIEHLTRSAELRSQGHAYDWLYLAQAHHELGQTQEAQRWLEKAHRWIQGATEPDAELDNLHAQTGHVLLKEDRSDEP